MIIQIIGNPCSGKSTFVKEFLKHNNFIWKDIAENNLESTGWLIVENDFLKNIDNKNNYIIESVMGFYQIKKSLVIKFICDYEDLLERHTKRRLKLTEEDLDYYNAMEIGSIKSDVIINTSVLRDYDQIITKLKPYIN